MWFLIKGSFWFSLVLVLLPIFSSASNSRLQDGPTVAFSDAFSAATGAYNYVAAICVEKPDVCKKGAETFTALGFRAREGALIAYEYLDTKFASTGKKPATDSKHDKDRTAQQDMQEPALAANDTAEALPAAADEVVTGTVVPLPMKKPAH